MIRALSSLSFATCLALLSVSARADIVTNGAYFYNVLGLVAGSPLQRPADTTAYAANQTVCQSKSTTCVPGTVAIMQGSGQRAMPTRVSMLKTGSTTTNAQFTIWMYSAPPVLTSPTQQDSTGYTGPRAADMPNYIGSAACNTAVATSDTAPQVWFECTLSNPNTAGALIAQPAPGLYAIYYLISVTAAYTPVSAETFTPYFSGFY